MEKIKSESNEDGESNRKMIKIKPESNEANRKMVKIKPESNKTNRKMNRTEKMIKLNPKVMK
jgi:hypothetical protein